MLRGNLILTCISHYKRPLHVIKETHILHKHSQVPCSRDPLIRRKSKLDSTPTSCRIKLYAQCFFNDVCPVLRKLSQTLRDSSNGPEIVGGGIIRDPVIRHPEGPISAPRATPRILHEDELPLIIVPDGENGMPRNVEFALLVPESQTGVEFPGQGVARELAVW